MHFSSKISSFVLNHILDFSPRIEDRSWPDSLDRSRILQKNCLYIFPYSSKISSFVLNHILDFSPRIEDRSWPHSLAKILKKNCLSISLGSIIFPCSSKISSFVSNNISLLESRIEVSRKQRSESNGNIVGKTGLEGGARVGWFICISRLDRAR